MNKLFFSLFFLFFVLINDGFSQTVAKLDTTIKNAAVMNTQVLDTEESLRYMGSELLFQLKKRLHLTSEEEEKSKDKKKEKVALSFLGIKIERE